MSQYYDPKVSMIERYEGRFQGTNSEELFHQCWRCEKPKGTVIITHGLAEHSECYNDLAQELGKSDWDVYAWDLYGHGRSPGKRGYAPEFSRFINDLSFYIKEVQKSHNGSQPLVMLGHSMGGLISIRCLQENPQPQISALCLSAPALGVAVKIPKLKERAAHFAAEWMPKLTLYNEIKYHDLTRDQNRIARYEADPLRHDKISAGVFLGMLNNFDMAFADFAKIETPLLMQVAGSDKVVSSLSAQEWFNKIQIEKKKMYIYSDSYHEIFNDLDRDIAIQDLKNFIGSL